MNEPLHTSASETAQAVLERLLKLASPEKLMAILGGVRQEETRQDSKTAFQEKYWLDPVAWARDCIRWRPGQGLTDYQEDVLAALSEHRRVCVRAPHGAGKSMIMAAICLWYATTRDGFDWKIVTTASNARQLKEYLWPEIHKWARRLRWERIGRKEFSERNELLNTELRLRTGQAFAATATDPSGIEGAHADHLLYVFDESKVVSGDTFDAAEGAFSGGNSETTEAFAISASTPGEPSGRFWEIQTNDKGKYSDWHSIAITKQQLINAGRMTTEWAEQRAVQWGERSFVYLNRVEGKFAAQGRDGVIPYAWVEMAQERWEDREGKPLVGPIILAVDVADQEGSDKTVVVIRVGKRLVEVHEWIHEDLMGSVARIIEIAASWHPERIVVDGIGLGSGVVSRLRELGFPVVAFIASQGTEMVAAGGIRFMNLRAAAWWSLRERLHPQLGESLELYGHEQLLPDLTAPTWRMPAERIIIESKDDIRRRLKRDEGRKDGGSPDVGDAVVMAYWDGANSTYEEAYDVHTATSLRAAEGPKALPTAEDIAAAMAKLERRQLFGETDDDAESAIGETIYWREALMGEQLW